MRSILLLILGGALLTSCHAEPPPTAAPPLAARPLQGIWQLDYYPDSLLLKKNIYAYSNWTAPYAATLRFAGDSCEFIGWHESGWEKLQPIGQGVYSTLDPDQGWEVKRMGTDALWFREYKPDDSTELWYPYHRVATVLTQAALQKRLAREVFAGKYRVLQCDRPADSVVSLGSDFSVRGLPGVTRYDVVTAMDWDFLLPNAFRWQDAAGAPVAQYSFEFAGDTLLLHDFEERPEDEQVPSGILVTAPTLKLLKKIPAGR